MRSVRIPLDFALGISDKCAQQKCPFASRQYLLRGSLLELGTEILTKVFNYSGHWQQHLKAVSINLKKAMAFILTLLYFVQTAY